MTTIGTIQRILLYARVGLYAAGVALVLGIVTPVAAQTGGTVREIDLNADTFVSDSGGGERVNRLSGNVTLKQDETRLWARQAVQYTVSDEILFTGRVRMVEATDTLQANSVRYYRQNKTGRARGNVILSDGDVVVRSPVAFHSIDRKYTRFEQGVHLIDSLTVLRSDRGEYWSSEKRALFTGGVSLTEKGSVTYSDTVNFFREHSIADATGNVFVQRLDAGDSDSSFVWLFGNRAHNESRNKYSTVDGRALLVQVRVDSASADTTAILADRLASRESGTVETMTGSGSVSIWRDKLAAIADSVSFRKVARNGEPTRETVWLFRNPVLWFETSQVTGDSIRLTIIDGELDSLYVDGNGFLAQEDSVLGRIQQVAGPTIRGALSGERRQLRIGRGADAIYFLADNGKTSGATKTRSQYVVMSFAGDSLRQITALGDIEGTYYADEIIPPSLQLPGLSWRPSRRPTRTIYATDPRFVSAQARMNK